MVALQILVLSVQVRILVSQQKETDFFESVSFFVIRIQNVYYPDIGLPRVDTFLGNPSTRGQEI